MTRIRFTVAGTHDLLLPIRNHLILSGYELVGPEDQPDFCLYGAYGYDLDKKSGVMRGIPKIVLSTGDVYTGVHKQQTPFTEDQVLEVPQVYDPLALAILFANIAEQSFIRTTPHTLVLRTFNVYGYAGDAPVPSLVTDFLNSGQADQPLCITSPGYQVSTYLHIDDLFVAINKLIPKFLGGARGVYNLGSPEEVSLRRLADAVWQHTHPGDTRDTPLTLVAPAEPNRWHHVPDVLRISALLNWKPVVSLQKGIWRLVHEVPEKGV